ncbi:MAG: M2 family metallopeptidase [Myxococcales bacterium]|nr:M2 family metallopeptidase [Myxococcales bacterium]
MDRTEPLTPRSRLRAWTPAAALLTTLALAACDSSGGAAKGPPAADAKLDAAREPSPDIHARTPEEAEQFVKENDAKLRALWVAAESRAWEQATNITPETEKAAAAAHEAVMEYIGEAIPRARSFDGVKVSPASRRQLDLLKTATTLPAPEDAERRAELARIATEMQSLYGKGEHCETAQGKQVCRDLGQLSDVLVQSRDPQELARAWTGWRTVSRGAMREKYERFVELGNEGAHAIGYADVGQLWRSMYDMSPEAFERELERLWTQVRPLYEQLHCHVRATLREKYGDAVVSADGMIPAHLLGNMWAQEWGNIYPLLEPYEGQPSIDVTAALQREGYDERKLVKTAESFFVSLGLDPLPATFWERSMFTKPPDRDVVCHASAWDVTYSDDLRIKMCIKINMEDLITIHHELGHNYYYHYYFQLPVLFQQGAHDGFHEGIGDTLALSVTPAYLHELGLLAAPSSDEKAVINKQMQDALDKIAFLPFGLLIDKWRWGVFSGSIQPARYNAAWWELRAVYQGVEPPAPRSEEDFDPGAKYHIPANTPYTRYFLARILQFQFHAALCEAAGHKGPLHTCSIHGSEAAGDKLRAMLELGASKPWPDALEAVAGTRTMDAGPMLRYFEPLQGYLAEQNQGRACGW